MSKYLCIKCGKLTDDYNYLSVDKISDHLKLCDKCVISLLKNVWKDFELKEKEGKK
jgi:hypothetical protein